MTVLGGTRWVGACVVCLEYVSTSRMQRQEEETTARMKNTRVPKSKTEESTMRAEAVLSCQVVFDFLGEACRVQSANAQGERGELTEGMPARKETAVSRLVAAYTPRQSQTLHMA